MKVLVHGRLKKPAAGGKAACPSNKLNALIHKFNPPLLYSELSASSESGTTRIRLVIAVDNGHFGVEKRNRRV